MNIGGIMRGLLGDLQAGDSRTIELKPGQTLRGVVVNLLEGDEAIVQLGGQQVRAKLELPLQPGQSTMLQVQAETQNGIVVLRPVDPGSAQMPEAAMRDLMRGLGLPDKSWARQLMLDMKREGVPLNRELAAAFTQASTEMPKQADPQQWMQAAALAFKRGLPMTATTISALQQAMFGRPAHELLDGLQSQLRTFLAGADAQQGGSGTQQLAARLLALLEQGLPLLRLSAESGQGGQTSPGSSGHVGQGNGGSAAQGNAATALPGNAASIGTGNAAAAATGGVGAGPAGLGTSAGAPVGQGNAASTAPGNAGAVSLANAGAGAAGAAGSNAAAQQALGTSMNGGPSATSLTGVGAPGAGTTAAGSPSNPAGAAISAGQAAPGHASGQAAGAGNATTSQTLSAGNGASAGSGGPSSSAALLGSLAGAGSPAGVAGQAASGSASGGGGAAAGAAGAGATTGASGWVGEMLRWLGVDHERQLLMRPAPGSAPGAAGASAGGAQPPATSGADGQAAAARPAEAPPQPLADRAAALAERAPGLPSGGPAGAAAAHAAEAGRPAAAQETLKGALLQLAARDDAPPALREAAQQLLQQVTGQQLLLSAERGGAMMSHLSIFIPLHAQDGNQTASVHIQTRRGRKGEIDASNCRLLFDLQMKQLGDTLVDVQVVDKIVSLTIWNDHPAIARLLETSRGQLAEAMTRSGYQLLTLRSTPLPSAEEREDAQAKKGALAGSAQLPDRGGYAAKPYRGVDLRA